MGMRTACPECGRADASEDDVKRHGCCFRCKVTTLRAFHWHGGGNMHSRDSFHNRTNAEVEREIVKSAERDGVEIQRRR